MKFQVQNIHKEDGSLILTMGRIFHLFTHFRKDKIKIKISFSFSKH